MKTAKELREMTLKELCLYLNEELLSTIEGRADLMGYVSFADIADIATVVVRILDTVDTVLLSAIIPCSIADKEDTSATSVLRFLNEAISEARKPLTKVTDFACILTDAMRNNDLW